MTFAEELKSTAMRVEKNRRYLELSSKKFIDNETLGNLAVEMRKAAEAGHFYLTVPLAPIVSERWKEASEKDYRSSSKVRFDEELGEYLELHFEGIRAKVWKTEVRFEWW